MRSVDFTSHVTCFVDSKVKTLGTKGSDEEDSAASWVAKSRKKEEDKILAEKRVSNK